MALQMKGAVNFIIKSSGYLSVECGSMESWGEHIIK